MLGVTLLVGGVVWSRVLTETAPAEGARSAEVTLDLSVQPPVAAEILVDGTLVDARPPRVKLPRGDRRVIVEVKAPGFRDAKLEVIPDRDVFLVVPLVSLPPKTPAPEPGPDLAGASPAASEGQPKAAKGPVGRPAATHEAAPSAKTAPNRDPLVTDNPF